MATDEGKFGDWIQKGFDLYKENFGILLLVTLLGSLISGFTAGILAGPMSIGMILVALALLDKKEPRPEVGDLFKGFGYFLQSFLFMLVWGVIMIGAALILSLIPCAGQVGAIVVIYALETLLMFALFIMAERNMDFWPASMESMNKVKENFWEFFGSIFV